LLVVGTARRAVPAAPTLRFTSFVPASPVPFLLSAFPISAFASGVRRRNEPPQPNDHTRHYQQLRDAPDAPDRPLVWITGAGGFIGGELVRTAGQLAPHWRVRALGRPQFDLLNFAAVEAEFRRDQPQLIIHCAAVSTPAEAKANPGLAQRLNVEATRLLAGLADHAALVFFSTDLVFDGRRGDYRETDAVNPLHFYGETKAAAEQVVLGYPRHLVLRTSITYGRSQAGNRTFNEQLWHALQTGPGMTLFTDEFRSPIPVEVTVRVLWDLVHQQRTGLFHVAGAEKFSRWEIGRLLLRRWPELQSKTNTVHPGSAKDFPGPPRALDTSLNIARVQSVLPFPVPGLTEWLAAHPHEPI
jgi:dTDP-4-dehydrorhamnose reductase